MTTSPSGCTAGRRKRILPPIGEGKKGDDGVETGSENSHGRPRVWISAVAFSLALFVGTTLWVTSGRTLGWEQEVLSWAQRAGEGPVRALFAAVTELGSAWVLVPLAVGLGMWAHRRGWRAATWVLWGGSLLAEAVNVLLKWLVGRERPQGFAENLPLTHAFPSGHAMVGTVVWALAAFLLVRTEPRWARPLAILVPILCLSIGLSRVFVGVHWPLDVVGGFAAGGVFVGLGKLAMDAAARHDSIRGSR